MAEEHGAQPRWGAFAYPNYRRFWLASLVRVFGLQFRIFGAGFLVIKVLELSPFWLGLVGLSQAIPTIVLSVPAGILADRMDNRRVLVMSQGATTLLHGTLALLVILGYANIWVVIAWALLSGSLTALGNPAQQAILPRLIEMRAMPSAVAFNSAIWNSMRIVGPATAGVLIAAIGVGQAFLVTAGGFAVSTLMLAALRLRRIERRAHSDDGGMMGGLHYIARHHLVLAVVGLSFFSSIFGMSYQFLMPLFALRILEVGSIGFGVMEAFAGVGALLGTISVVRLGAARYRGQVMIGAAALFGVAVAGFATTTIFPLSLVLLFGAGFLSSVYLNVGMTALQITVPDELRGRVMGVWSMTWFLTSVGGFVVGSGAELIGTQGMVAAGGLAVTAVAVGLYVLSPEVRAIPGMQAPRPARAPAGGD